MKILYIQNKFSIGGITRVTSVKANYLVNHGFEVHNLNTEDDNTSSTKKWFSNKIHFHVISKDKLSRLHSVPIVGRLLRYFYFRIKFLNIIFQINPDIIISTQPILEPLSVILMTFWKKRILEFQGWYCGVNKDQLVWLDKWYGFTKYRIYNNVSLTYKEAVHFKKLTGCDSHFINNANYMNFEKQAVCEAKQVLILSRFSREKGIVEFLPAWKTVESVHSDWKLCLYGQGSEEELIKKIITEQGLKNVTVYPYTNDVESVYMKSSIFLLPSIFEGWGMTLIESMSLGVPCVAYDCPFGPSEIINNGEDGFVVKYMSSQDMVDKIIYLIEHDDVRKEMGRKARNNVQRFSLENIMKKWQTYFNSI